MSFGQKATKALFALFDKAKLSGRPGATSREALAPDMADLLDELHAKEKPKAKNPRATTAEIDAIWLGELEQLPAFAGIDVKRQLGMAQVWAETNRRTVTRKFFVNWLNRAVSEGRAVAVNGQGQSSFARKSIVNDEPGGWRETLMVLHPSLDREAVNAKAWADLSLPLKDDVRKANR